MKYWRTPLDADRVTVPRGAVRVDRERCKGCGICIEFCTKKGLVSSREFNKKGYHPPCLKDGTECGGCDLCGMYCPDFAIFGARYAR